MNGPFSISEAVELVGNMTCGDGQKVVEVDSVKHPCLIAVQEELRKRLRPGFEVEVVVGGCSLCSNHANSPVHHRLVVYRPYPPSDYEEDDW